VVETDETIAVMEELMMVTGDRKKFIYFCQPVNERII